MRPRKALELGSGRPTVSLARALRDQGDATLWSMEHDVHHLDETRERLLSEGITEGVQLIHGPIGLHRSGPFFGLWYDARRLPRDRTFDFVLIDGPPARTVGRFMSLPVLWPHLDVGALLLLDEANRADLEGAWLNIWQRRYGGTLAVELFPGFHRGLALLMKLSRSARPIGAGTIARYARVGLRHAALMIARRVRARIRAEKVRSARCRDS